MVGFQSKAGIWMYGKITNLLGVTDGEFLPHSKENKSQWELKDLPTDTAIILPGRNSTRALECNYTKRYVTRHRDFLPVHRAIDSHLAFNTALIGMTRSQRIDAASEYRAA